ncbi:MAG: 2-amino-4-hydroxy-6-hydroxymethyldihydropteridine diphosphokinase [Oligoflexales bacterium]|nr:2-amino-4-hydroxy-6-hydroxymethyldihydropteridine diphosphokinase [Oligoflexales bacterium]
MKQESPTYRYILSFGSNLGDCHAHFDTAVLKICSFFKIRKSSKRIWTKALKLRDSEHSPGADFLNSVVEGLSDLAPEDLYKKLSVVEDEIGHSRMAKGLPRQIDIDILFVCLHREEHPFLTCPPLFYNGNTDQDLSVPHREFWNRPFLADLIQKDLQIDLIKQLSCSPKLNQPLETEHS